MLLGGDLGLFLSVTTAAVLVVGLLLLRTKWRRVVARRLEIERLMALAYEEAARAEVEAVTGYERSYLYTPVVSELVVEEEEEEEEEEEVAVVGQKQLQYQCEVCFTPTTTRCKQCKSVHYCSPKCQIIHWRQGHKYECHSLSLHQNNDTEIHSRPKEFEQNDIESASNVTGDEIRHTTESVPSGEMMFSSPNFHALGGRNENGGGKHDHFKEASTRVGAADTPRDESSSNTSTYISVPPDKKSVNLNRYATKSISADIASVKPLLSEQPVLTNHEDSSATAADDKLNYRARSRKPTVTESQLSRARSRKTTVPGPNFVEKECPAPLGKSGYVRNDRSGTNLPSRVMDKLRSSNFIPLGSSDRGTEIIKKYKGSFSYELFVKLYNWNKIDLRPCGLVNCGNSCYANAVLQCLSFTPPLTAYFLEGLHSKSCKKQEWCFACELEILVKKVKGSYSPISPSRIISQIQCIGRHLGDGKEEDAHEFLRYAIDAMQSACLKGAGINKPSSLDEETSVIGLTFGGRLRSKIECTRCGGISEQHERIMDLTVEIGGDIKTLEEALRQFTHSEILDGENKYYCGRCKLYVKAKKKLKVSEAPNILTIALKRFQSGHFGKLNKAVKFPEILNLAPYMCGTADRTPIYALYGVVVHLDVMNDAYSGHYVCYIKNNQGMWFQADDSMVRNVEVEKVLSKGAYMLLYARCSPRAPGAVRSSMVSVEPRKSSSTTCKHKSHPTESWDVSIGNLNSQYHNDCIYEHCKSHHTPRADSEDGNSSENSSFFSESGSHTTDSSTNSTNRESTSTDENLDHILRDLRNYWTNPSDSDTSSSSSSTSPSGLHGRLSPLADQDRNSDRDGFWSRTSGSGVCPDLDRDRELENLVCRKSSYRENDSSRLGVRNNMKGGVYLRRSATGRTVEN